MSADCFIDSNIWLYAFILDPRDSLGALSAVGLPVAGFTLDDLFSPG